MEWCTEDIVDLGKDFRFEFTESLTDPSFLKGLRRYASFVSDTPLLLSSSDSEKKQSESFPLSALKYLVPIVHSAILSDDDDPSLISDETIEQWLINFGDSLLRPHMAYVFLGDPDASGNVGCTSARIPLKIGLRINPSLIQSVKKDYCSQSLRKSHTQIWHDPASVGEGSNVSVCLRSKDGLKKMLITQLYFRTHVRCRFPWNFECNATDIEIALATPDDSRFKTPSKKSSIFSPLSGPSSSFSSFEKDDGSSVLKWLPLSALIEGDSEGDSSGSSSSSSTKNRVSFVEFGSQSELDSSMVIDQILKVARLALKSANMQQPFSNQVESATVYSLLRMSLTHDRLPSDWMSSKDYESGPLQSCVYRFNVNGRCDFNHALKLFITPVLLDDSSDQSGIVGVDCSAISALIREWCVDRDTDMFHQYILDSDHCNADSMVELISDLTTFLGQSHSDSLDSDPLLYLKQERALIIIADTIWTLRKRFPTSFRMWIKSVMIDDEQQKKEMLNILTNEPKHAASLESRFRRLIELDDLDIERSESEDLTEYVQWLEPFLKCGNERELRDFDKCARSLLSEYESQRPEHGLRLSDKARVHACDSGMRVGISSGNASDNWTNVKMRGGVTVNACINLIEGGGVDFSEDEEEEEHKKEEDCDERSDRAGKMVFASVCSIPERMCLELITTHTMTEDGQAKTERLVFEKPGQDVISISDGSWTDPHSLAYASEESFYKLDDPRDVFRMLKYALVFTGIISDNSSCFWSSIDEYTGSKNHGLRLELKNIGPSRSGFASSSAVACNLLNVLYKASDIDYDELMVGSLALLFENKLGLKSGRQDVDGLLPGGLKLLDYPHPYPDVCAECDQSKYDHSYFVVPKVSRLSGHFDQSLFSEHVCLVNSGIPRAAGLGIHRGLNMRFWAYLSRNPARYLSIVKSLNVHRQIIESLDWNNYTRLGRLFTDYMQCRERIDPGATQSIHDTSEVKILRHLFDPLIQKGLISGGMYSGAMGGGVAMMVLPNRFTEDQKTTLMSELDKLKSWVSPKSETPFHKLNVFKYEINQDGLQYYTRSHY